MIDVLQALALHRHHCRRNKLTGPALLVLSRSKPMHYARYL